MGAASRSESPDVGEISHAFGARFRAFKDCELRLAEKNRLKRHHRKARRPQFLPVKLRVRDTGDGWIRPSPRGRDFQESDTEGAQYVESSGVLFRLPANV